jgi:predicted MFS family arabinose efflux permease
MEKTRFAFAVFTLMNFVLSMTAFVFGGILDQVAISMNISVANSGLLNAMYAYGAALGGPVVLILFRNFRRVRMLQAMLAITIIMTFWLVLTRNFAQLLFIRLVTGISANSYGVLAVATVVAMSPKEKLGRSMALLIMGSSLALVVGIPLTRALSSVLDWRSIFWILNAMMLLSLGYFIVCLPPGTRAPAKLDMKSELAYLKDRRTVRIIAYTLVMFIGYGAVYTYATPYLLHQFPFMDRAMSFVLVLLGAASFVGNLLGGRALDRIGYAKSMKMGILFQTASMLLVLVIPAVPWLGVTLILLWMASAWFTGLQLNAGIAQETHNQSSFILSINSSALQLGTALGSSMSALVISRGGMQNIVFLPLLAGLCIFLIQLLYKRNLRKA